MDVHRSTDLAICLYQLQASIDKLASNMDLKSLEYTKLDERIIKLAGENKEFYEKALKYKEILNRHETLSQQKENRQMMVSDLLEEIEEMPNGQKFVLQAVFSVRIDETETWLIRLDFVNCFKYGSLDGLDRH